MCRLPTVPRQGLGSTGSLCNPDAPELCRWAALHLASQEGQTETAKALVAAGADVHCEDNFGYGAGAVHGGAVGERVVCRR